MTQDEQIQQLKEQHDKLQEGLASDQMCIREGIVLNVGEGEYDSYPRYGFQFFCWRSHEMVQEMDAFIKYSKGRNRLLDCGAYHGIFSMVFCEINKGAVANAIEPFLEPFEVLVKNTNPYINIFCINGGLSDRQEEVLMRIEGGHLKEGDDGNSIKILCQSWDKVTDSVNRNFKGNLPRADTIKVDVEGMELKVLKGLEKTLEEIHPLIFIELHTRQLSNDEVTEIIDFLKWYNYKPMDTRTDQPITWEEIQNFKDGELRLVLL